MQSYIIWYIATNHGIFFLYSNVQLNDPEWLSGIFMTHSNLFRKFYKYFKLQRFHLLTLTFNCMTHEMTKITLTNNFSCFFLFVFQSVTIRYSYYNTSLFFFFIILI